jgi:hypothetical protein
VLTGDLNASFIRPKPTVRDKLFMQDIVEMGFVLRLLLLNLHNEFISGDHGFDLLDRLFDFFEHLSALLFRIFINFEICGTPKNKDSPLWMNCITAKRNLRRAQRQEEARKRNQLYSDIMESHMINDKLFYKIVNSPTF